MADQTQKLPLDTLGVNEEKPGVNDAMPEKKGDELEVKPGSRLTAGHVLVPLGALLCLLPFVSTGLGLLAGLVVAMVFGNPFLERTRGYAHKLLALAVVGLGAGMNLVQVAKVGAHGIVYTAVGIAICLTLGLLLARVLRVSRDTGALITIGTAICGGSAIAAVVPVLRPKEHEVSVALGTVFALNAAALFLFPPIGHWLGLTDGQFGLWSALAIHDTSSVVGAAVAFGGRAVETATTVKLARALWIVPLTLAVARWYPKKNDGAAKGKPRRPWFIAGFVLAAALVTFVPMLQPVGHLVFQGSKQLLVLTLFLIGANLTRSAIREVGVRPLAMGLLLWIGMGTLSLLGILSGFARLS